MLNKFFNWLVKPAADLIEDLRSEDKISFITQAIGLKSESNKVPLISKGNVSSTYRPQSFDNYIGQEKAKSILKSFIEGTKKRSKVFPHLLIYGPAGCGKSTLARIIAKELNVDFRQVIATTIDDSNYIINLAEEVNGGIVFLDEVHGLDREACEPLYNVMEDFIAYGEEVIKPFTLIGATTEVGELIKDRRPFYDRFKIKIELENYTKNEMKAIVRKYGQQTFPTEVIDAKTIEMASLNCRSTPRRAISLLESSVYLSFDYKRVLETYGIISNGYTYKDLKVLEYIALNSGVVGLEALSSYLNTSKENYTYEIEPYLLINGLIVRASRGRKLTDEGYKMIQKLNKKIKEKSNGYSN